MTPEKLGSAKLIEESTLSDDSKIVRVTGTNPDAKTCTILMRGSNGLVIDEADRSLHDALCVVRCLVKNKGLICGGGSAEIEIS